MPSTKRKASKQKCKLKLKAQRTGNAAVGAAVVKNETDVKPEEIMVEDNEGNQSAVEPRPMPAPVQCNMGAHPQQGYTRTDPLPYALPVDDEHDTPCYDNDTPCYGNNTPYNGDKYGQITMEGIYLPTKYLLAASVSAYAVFLMAYTANGMFGDVTPLVMSGLFASMLALSMHKPRAFAMCVLLIVVLSTAYNMHTEKHMDETSDSARNATSDPHTEQNATEPNATTSDTDGSRRNMHTVNLERTPEDARRAVHRFMALTEYKRAMRKTRMRMAKQAESQHRDTPATEAHGEAELPRADDDTEDDTLPTTLFDTTHRIWAQLDTTHQDWVHNEAQDDTQGEYGKQYKTKASDSGANFTECKRDMESSTADEPWPFANASQQNETAIFTETTATYIPQVTKPIKRHQVLSGLIAILCASYLIADLFRIRDGIRL